MEVGLGTLGFLLAVSDLANLVEELLEWTTPVVRGTRSTQMCRDVTDEFWDLWKEQKDELRDLGIRAGRDDDTKEFYLTWVRSATDDKIPEQHGSDIPQHVVRFLKCPQDVAVSLPYLYPDQRDAYYTLMRAAEAGGMTLDASDPGIGKTWVALQLMKSMTWNFGIICPANVVTKWTDTAVSEPFNLEPEFVLSYDKLRAGRTDFVSRFQKGEKRIKRWFEWNVEEDSRVTLIFDEVHMCAGEKSLNSLLLKAAIENPRVYVHALSATTADSPLDLNVIGYGLGLHDGKEHWRWCQKVGAKRGHFGGLTFSTGGTDREPTLNQRRARAGLSKIHGHIFPKRGCRIVVGDSELWRPKNQIFAELVDVDEKHPKIQDALRLIDEKEDADFEKANEKEVEVSSLTFNTRDRQRAELFKLPSFLERVQHLRAAGSSVVVFLNYRLSIELLSEWMTENFVTIVGGLSTTTRNEQMRLFQSNSTRVCICQTDAGAQSIDLDDQGGANARCSLISPGYDAKRLYQALGRCYRPASTKSLVRQWVLFAVGTVEERVGRLVQVKLNGQAMINDGDLRGAIDVTPK